MLELALAFAFGCSLTGVLSYWLFMGATRRIVEGMIGVQGFVYGKIEYRIQQADRGVDDLGSYRFEMDVLTIWSKWMNSYLTHQAAMEQIAALVEKQKENKS